MIKETMPQGGATFARNGSAAAEEPVVNRQQVFQEMKSRLHRAIINRMDLKKLGQLEAEQLHAEVARLAEDLLHAESTPLSSAERERLVEEVDWGRLSRSSPTRPSATSSSTRPRRSTSSAEAVLRSRR
jgi:hypothetical protein